MSMESTNVRRIGIVLLALAATGFGGCGRYVPKLQRLYRVSPQAPLAIDGIWKTSGKRPLRLEKGRGYFLKQGPDGDSPALVRTRDIRKTSPGHYSAIWATHNTKLRVTSFAQAEIELLSSDAIQIRILANPKTRFKGSQRRYTRTQLDDEQAYRQELLEIDAAQIVLDSWGNYIHIGTDTEELLLSIGKPALRRLISGLDETPQEDRGKLVIAIALWREDAHSAIEKIIEYFPISPKQEISIRIENPDNRTEIDQLLKTFGRGEITSQSTGTVGADGAFVQESRTRYWFVSEVPAAAAALFAITNEHHGNTQEDWVLWLENHP